MTNIIMVGCNGHMGQMISSIVSEDADIEIIAGVDISEGKDNPYPVYKNISEIKEVADAIVDFSSPKVLSDVLSYAVERNVPLVECSTGYTEEEKSKITDASKKVAVVRSANMSVGINLLMKLLKTAAKKLVGEGYDVEIVEKHHNLKKDAPSGTALALADSINEASDNRFTYVYDRSKVSRARDKNELGISAIRGGTIVGDHDVIFAGTDEVITFSHSAYSKAVFAKGAIVAAKYIKGKGPGMYDMQDVLDI